MHVGVDVAFERELGIDVPPAQIVEGLAGVGVAVGWDVGVGRRTVRRPLKMSWQNLADVSGIESKGATTVS